MADDPHDHGGTPPPAPPSDSDAPAEQPPAWFVAFAERIEGRLGILGTDFAKLRKTVKSPDAAPAAATAGERPESQARPSPGGGGRDDLAVIRYAELRAQLPVEMRGKLDARLAEGGSLAEAMYAAELLAEQVAAQRDAAPRGPVPRGQPGAPAAPASQHPSTRGEWALLCQSADKGDATAVRRRNSLLMDDTFDPFGLPD